MHKTLPTFIFLLAGSIALGQGSVDSVLASISAKNKTLEATFQNLETQRLQYRTGLTPYNPTADYDYMIGTPSNAGNQTDMIIVQSFDFPTAYKRKAQVADEQVKTLEFEAEIHRQSVLLNAKLVCIELIYLNKHIVQVKIRVANAQRVNDDLDTKLLNEEISAIAANKAKLMLLNVNTKFQLLKSQREQLLLKLTQMNGGEAIALLDKRYPELPEVPQVDTLEISIESVDPMLKLYEGQITVSKLQIRLTKAMTFPKIETGYHYQSILGQTFNGVHFGVSIPLWENKNKVKRSKAYALFTEIKLEQHRIDHKFEIRELHKKYETLKESIAEYKTVLDALSTEELLQKSLELGQISFMEYALEMEYYYNAFDQYLQLEKQLHLTVAKLYKHKL